MRLALLVLFWLVALHGSIFSDAVKFFTHPGKTVSDLAGKVWGAIKKVLNWATAVFRNVGAAWGDLHFSFRTLISGLEHLAEGSYSALRWLALSHVPKWARKAVTDAISWATRNIKTVASTAIKLAGQVKTWALRRINDVLDYARKGLRSLRALANSAIHWIKHQGARVWDIVMHPKKLVTWILPSLVTPLMRWIMSHVEAVSTLILSWFFSNVGRFVPIIERVLAKLF